ncbi:MAG: hypothetical protein GWP08_03465, partial [Nitrospiraceae bacterium]|nr:hypothetical protein [Nitrospiraceae bacterium]
WRIDDLPGDPTWRKARVKVERTEHGLELEGRFNDVHQIDNLSADDPSFWVPLSSPRDSDSQFPIDTVRYPIVEITYRCTSVDAHPAWLVTYRGGALFDWLPPTPEWRTSVRCVQQLGFPKSIDGITLRLYAASRSVESFEIQSIRFREPSPREAAALEHHQSGLEMQSPPEDYPILKEFLPFGTFMDAGSSKRIAAMLGISPDEYWALALEDLARNHHNTVALEGVDHFTEDEWTNLLETAGQFGIKFFAIHNLPVERMAEDAPRFIQTHIAPHAGSDSILAWCLHDEPPEHALSALMQTRDLMRQADPNHPIAVTLRTPNAMPLYGRTFPVCALPHYDSHLPWDMGSMVRTHLPLTAGHSFWAIAPTFIYATGTPEWHTCPEMRLMMNLAFANGARGWLTFSYHNDPIWIRGSCQRSLTGPFLTFSDLWSELGQRVESLQAIAPLFLKATPQADPEKWFVTDSVAHTNAQFPEGMEPTGVYRLAGDDFDLYCVTSNDIREMMTVHIDTSSPTRNGLVLYDLADYARTRRWTAMPTKRHLEMFPGQQHIILAAAPAAAERWRDTIAERLIAGDRRRLTFDLPLAQAYGLDTTDIEWRMAGIGHSTTPEALDNMRRARDILLDLIYASPKLYESRSKLIEVSAALCACDGSLCRLLGQGQADVARQMGFKVIPLAREMTHLRIELRQGRGRAIFEQCRGLAKRTSEILYEIRALFRT